MRAEFSKQTKHEAWLRAAGRCEECKQEFGERRPEYDHIIAAAMGGDNTLGNCKCLCPKCHRTKTSLQDIPCIAKSNRVREKRTGIRRSKYQWPKRRLTRSPVSNTPKS